MTPQGEPLSDNEIGCRVAPVASVSRLEHHSQAEQLIGYMAMEPRLLCQLLVHLIEY